MGELAGARTLAPSSPHLAIRFEANQLGLSCAIRAKEIGGGGDGTVKMGYFIRVVRALASANVGDEFWPNRMVGNDDGDDDTKIELKDE